MLSGCATATDKTKMAAATPAATIRSPTTSTIPRPPPLVAAGVKAILNFSPGTLKVPADVKVKGVDLTVSLESLSFYLAHGDLSTVDE